MKSQSPLPLASTMSPAMSNKQEEFIASKDTRMQTSPTTSLQDGHIVSSKTW